jgi:hypothetical protein
VHDISDLELRGLPGVFVATCQFEDGAIAQEKALGADLAAVYTEHPIQDRTDAEMLAIADRAYEAVLKALTQ